MQMRLEKQPQEPIKIWLRGMIDDSDIEILWREAQHLLSQKSECLWLYVEQIPRLTPKALSFLIEFVNLCAQNQLAVLCIVHQESLYRVLLQHQLPVQRYDPERKNNKAQLF